MDIQQNTNQPPIASGEDSDNPLFDLGNNIQLSESQDSIYHYFVASPVFAGFGNLDSPERLVFIENLGKISSSLKNYLTSSDTTELIFSLGKEAGCDDSQISEIGVLIRDLLTGRIFIKDFSITLASKLGIDDVKAGELANKVISQSFGPIIEDVKRIQRSKFPEKIMQLQKEGRPTGLSQIKPPLPTPQFSSIQRPSEERGSIEHNSANIPPRPQLDAIQPPQKPIQQAFTPQMSVPLKEQPKKPEFKIPDLGPFDSLRPSSGQVAQGKQPVVRQSSPPVTKENGNNAQKSLEEELAKVASVIDLRNKPKK